MEKLLIGTLVAVGLINFLPLVGVAGPARLTALYGLAFDDPNLVILMRHRAVLFGLIGAFIMYAAFHPGLRPHAAIAALVSMLSFVALALAAGDYNEHLRKVVAIDVAAAAALALVLVLYYWRRA